MTMNGNRHAPCRPGAIRLLARVEDAHDRRVRHAGGRLRLLTEPHAERGVVRQLRLQELDRHLTAEAGVGAAVDVGHAAATDECTDAVTPRKHALASRSLLVDNSVLRSRRRPCS